MKVVCTQKETRVRPDKKKTNEVLPNSPGPFRILKDAIAAVPAVKYALGVAGIGAAIAIIKTLVTDLRTAFFGIILMLLLMTVLFVFAKLATIAGKDIKIILLALIWFSLLLFFASGTSLFTSVFFKWPVDLQYWIAIDHPIGSVSNSMNDLEAGAGRPSSTTPNAFDLTGHVRDEKGDLSDVDILEINTGERTKSDPEGRFTLTIKQPTDNRIRIRASKNGYQIWEEYVERRPGLIISLEKD